MTTRIYQLPKISGEEGGWLEDQGHGLPTPPKKKILNVHKVFECVSGIYVFAEDRNILRSFLIESLWLQTVWNHACWRTFGSYVRFVRLLE